MSALHPSGVRRLALRVFRLLPVQVSHAIVHALTTTYTAGAVAIIEHDGRVLALRQLHRTGWSLPGGLVERGEQPSETVVREVWEETGIRIDPGQSMATSFSSEIRHVDVIFRIVCDERPEVRVASEALEAGWFALDELPAPDKSTRHIVHAVQLARKTPDHGRVLGWGQSPDE